MATIEFKAFIKNNEIAIESLQNWEKDSYLKQFNKEYWMKLALEFAQNNDIAEYPKCRDDTTAQPIEIEN